MTHPSKQAAWLIDARRVLKTFEVTPGLPYPHISRYRTSFHFTGITSRDEAAEAVADAQAVLSFVFKVTFEPVRTQLGSARHYLLETPPLDSGMVLCLVAQAEHFDGDTEDAPELIGAAA